MSEPVPPPTFTPPPGGERSRPVEDAQDPMEVTNPGFPLFQYDYLKRKLSELDGHFEQNLKRHDNKLTVRSIMVAVGAVTAGVIAAVLFVDNRVAAQTDAGIKGVVEQVKGQDARLTTLEKRFDRFDEKLDRASEQNEIMLDRLGVPKWKRPPPLDGGTP
jgi:hypothetical protein